MQPQLPMEKLTRVVALVALLLPLATCSSPQQLTTPPASLAVPQDPPRLVPIANKIAPDLPPLAANLGAVRPSETTRMAYEFAARHPEVLKYIPCFCGCEQMGHKGNDDCFVAGRDSSGKTRDWQPHGAICEKCIDIATMAMQMRNSGATLTAIRAAVEKRFAGQSTTHTPTPMPPHGGGHQD
jgi:uncharacterized protein with PCYCGC motif